VEEGYDCEKHNTDFQKTGSQVLFCFSLIFSCFALLVVSTQVERVAGRLRKEGFWQCDYSRDDCFVSFF
jgi:hypothetical protein